MTSVGDIADSFLPGIPKGCVLLNLDRQGPGLAFHNSSQELAACRKMQHVLEVINGSEKAQQFDG